PDGMHAAQSVGKRTVETKAFEDGGGALARNAPRQADVVDRRDSETLVQHRPTAIQFLFDRLLLVGFGFWRRVYRTDHRFEGGAPRRARKKCDAAFAGDQRDTGAMRVERYHHAAPIRHARARWIERRAEIAIGNELQIRRR